MDYSKLSDKEINKLVAFEFGCKEVVPDIFMSDDRRYEFDKPKNKSGNKFYFDPCNNPADAWPIITENNISIILDNPTMPCATANARDLFDAADPVVHVAYDNPLRAAMVVYLMMQEAE